MRILIQHSGTQKFLRDGDAWADSYEGARLFPNSIEAFRHCTERQLSGVNIIVERDAPRSPVIIPVEFNASNGRITTGFPISATRQKS